MTVKLETGSNVVASKIRTAPYLNLQTSSLKIAAKILLNLSSSLIQVGYNRKISAAFKKTNDAPCIENLQNAMDWNYHQGFE